MPNNWKTYKLSEVIKIIGGGTPKTSESSYWNGNIPWLSVKDFQGERKYVYETEKYITEEGLKKSSTKLLPKDSIIISARGTVGEMAVLGREMTFNQSCYGILPNERITNDYLYYLLKQKVIELQGLSYGSVFDTITTKTFDGLDVLIPENLQEQKSIATILSTIDDKIENNLAINKTLEEMAMALYKHWFVDFGPFQDGEFVDSELGKIPKGWEVKRLDEFVNLTMGQSPKSEFYNLNNEGLPFHQGVTNYGERFPEDKTYSTEGNRFAEEGDILFSVRAPVGRLNIAKNKIILGRGLSSMTLKNHDNNGFLFYSLKNFFTEDDKIGDGTVYGSVNKTELENLKFIIPCKEVIDNFNDLVKDIDSKYLNNYKENQTLTQLRDTLLPKLISGEVRLKEFVSSDK